MRFLPLYRALLYLYPPAFRHEYGGEMTMAFADDMRDAQETGQWWREAAVWLSNAAGVLATAPTEHLHVIHQDLRYAIRTFAAAPGFTAVAVLSLAFGIGANTAIFSLLNSVLMRTLPVSDPASLVILTNPASAGVSNGSNTGVRALMAYPEFRLIQQEVDSFSGVFAAQSSMSRVEANVGDGGVEELQVRMVSAGYFDVLGVDAIRGRTWSGAESESPSAEPEAVISYEYWQRRFGGKDTALGAKIRLRAGAFTVVGVMPASFFGETVGDRPEAWVPLSAQSLVLPGRDWLHDVPGRVEKIMWLHVLARLKPGVALAEAEAHANVSFQRSIQSYYSSRLDPETAKRYADQQLKLSPAATGASPMRRQFAEPLIVLLVAAAAVLLIACANLGNLLLARVTARGREMAVRLALGAGHGRLVQQLLTESLVLAVAGGLAGLGVAWLVRTGLLLLVGDSIDLSVATDWSVMAFAFGLTIAAGVLLGMLPALRLLGPMWRRASSIKHHAGAEEFAGLREEGRGTMGSAASIRMGRAVVVGQLALSVPLLVGAGLLLLTLYNLQRVDVGFPKEGLVMARLDLSSGGYEGDRALAFLERLRERVARIPGMRAISYSDNGVFMGSTSGDRIEVEGYKPPDGEPYGSEYDQVGPGFFSTLRIPILRGREIGREDAPPHFRACVVNESFVKQFFEGRDPLGRQITQIFGKSRKTCEVVGVVRNSRHSQLRDEVEPRFFVPALHPLETPSGAAFALRAQGDPRALVEPFRKAVAEMDPNVTIVRFGVMPELVGRRMAQDRLLARLAVAFGVVALALSMMGLYGVLSFAVARRTREIGVRKALGAQQGAVLGMIFRETGWLLAIGLALGVGIAMAVLRLITSRLYGLEPTDPAMYAAAVAILAAVGFVAAWFPAHRASRVDPLIALRYE